jgi:hypothetical protein
MATPLFFLTFFLLGSELPCLFALNPGAEGGSGRFCGLEVGPGRLEGGGIFPEAGRRGRPADGLCLGGNSRSSTSGSLLRACNLALKKACTKPICEDTFSEVMRGYGGGGGKTVTDWEVLSQSWLELKTRQRSG